MVVRGALSPLSIIIFEIVYSIGQGNFTFVRKNVREFQKTLAVAIMNNFCLISFHFFMVSTIWKLSCIKDGLYAL